MGTSGAQRPQPAGFLACSSSSSAFCFHQWTTILHLCCVSKYLLAFLFLITPTVVGACLCACECVWFACLYTHRILPSAYTDMRYLPLPSVRCRHSHISAMLPRHPVPPPTILCFSPSLHHAFGGQSWEETAEEVIAVFSCSVTLPATTEVYAPERTRGGGNPASKCMWPQRAKPLHTPTTLKVAHTQTYSLSFPRAQWPHAREAFLPAVKTKETGDRQGTWGRCFKATGSASVVSSCGGCWSVEGQLPVFSQPGTNKDECVVCVCHIIGKISEHAALQLLSALYDLRSLPSYTLVCRNKRDNTCTDTHTPSSSSFLWSVKFWLKAESR